LHQGDRRENRGPRWLLVGGRLAVLDGLSRLREAAGEIEDVVRHVDRDHEWGSRDGSVFGTGGDVCPSSSLSRRFAAVDSDAGRQFPDVIAALEKKLCTTSSR
jgi:hypothetical protein